MNLFLLALLLLFNNISHAQQQRSKQTNTYDFDLQGHRGARGLAPENTIPAFQKALHLKVNTLELDVVISKDDKVVVSHEPWINPIICLNKQGDRLQVDYEKELNMYQMNYKEIKDYNCGSLLHPDFSNQKTQAAKKPLLKDVIQLVLAHNRQIKNKVSLNIELKSDEKGYGVFHPQPEKFVDLVVNCLKENQLDFTLQSFDLRILKHLHKFYPNIKNAALTEYLSLDQMIKKLGFKPDIFSPHYFLVDNESVKKVHAQDIKVIPWTVNQVDTMEKLLANGVDGLITDYPNRALVFKP